MFAFFTRLRLLPTLLRTGRLALALFRDPRTPLLPKLILGAAVAYVLSPLDFLPDLVPILGQLDDVAILTLGVELFFKYVPDWLRGEHEAKLGRTATGARVIDTTPSDVASARPRR